MTDMVINNRVIVLCGQIPELSRTIEATISFSVDAALTAKIEIRSSLSSSDKWRGYRYDLNRSIVANAQVIISYAGAEWEMPELPLDITGSMAVVQEKAEGLSELREIDTSATIYLSTEVFKRHAVLRDDIAIIASSLWQTNRAIISKIDFSAAAVAYGIEESERLVSVTSSVSEESIQQYFESITIPATSALITVEKISNVNPMRYQVVLW